MEKEHNNHFLKHYPNNFDPEVYELSSFLGNAAIEIDLNLIGKEADFRITRTLGRIMYMAFDQDQFKNKFKNNFTLRDTLSNYLGDTSEELDYQEIALGLIKLKGLSNERKEELRDICVSLSKGFSAYWDFKNPHGFKTYLNTL